MTNAAEKFKIIVADDHPIFRAGIKSALKGVSFIDKITEAANGKEVIKLLDNEAYDLVLMDIKMAPMNGIETTEVISKRHPTTKVIALSMHSEQDYIVEIFEKGASGYLIKNADKAEIENAIKVVLNGGQYYSKEVSQTLLTHLHRLRNPPDFDTIQKDRIKDITYLICHEFSNQEIGELVFLSPRTIEGYRGQIYKATKTNSLVGLIKFALENKLLDDEELKKKFAKALANKESSK
jgi:DNA-binding NarL/FixJ family response regulator